MGKGRGSSIGCLQQCHYLLMACRPRCAESGLHESRVTIIVGMIEVGRVCMAEEQGYNLLSTMLRSNGESGVTAIVGVIEIPCMGKEHRNYFRVPIP